MGCADLIMLQRLLDDELDEAQAEIVAHHVQSCPQCGAFTRELLGLRSFVQYQLGVEDEDEDASSRTTLRVVARRLPAPQPVAVRSAAWWRRTWLATAAVALLALLFPVVFGPNARASAEGILQEVVARERIWAYQPNRVLHWQVDTVSQGVKGIADGQWRTRFWQKNESSTFAQISRQFDPQGRTEQAYWRLADGSTISYRAKAGNVIEILPSTASAQAALSTLTPELRMALESYVARRETMRSLYANSRREADWLHRPSVGTSGETVTFRRGLLDQLGEVHHIQITKGPSANNAEIARSVHEYDVERSTYRLLRLKSTVSYVDRTVGVHDSRWTVFRDISAAEFDEQTPRDLLDSGMPVVRLTPLDVARQRLQELNRERTRTN